MENNYFEKYPELKEFASNNEEYKPVRFYAKYFENLNITCILKNFHGVNYYIIDYNYNPIKAVNYSKNFKLCKKQESLENNYAYKKYKGSYPYKITVEIGVNQYPVRCTYNQIYTLNYLKYFLQFQKHFYPINNFDVLRIFQILIDYNKINLKRDNALDKISYKFLEELLNSNKSLIYSTIIIIFCLNQYYNIVSQEYLLQFLKTTNDLMWFQWINMLNSASKNTIKYYFKQQLLKSSYNDYVDYIKMRERLPKDLQKRFSTYPENVNEAHKKIILIYNQILMQKREEENKLLQESYQEFYPKAKEFEFSNENYSIIACKEVSELIREGLALNHCVGSYRESVSKGKEYILFLRKNSELEIPYYTIDITPDKQIRQIHGKCNCNLTEELKPFIKEWKEKFDLKGSFNSVCCHL